MSSQKPAPSRDDVEQAMSQSAALDSVQRHRPHWDDYVSEGVIDSVPDSDASGEHRVQVRGHENVVKMLKMNEEANRLAAWHGDNQAESPARRTRREEREERVARKRHKPRAMFVVPEMPWKRKKESA